MYVLTSPLGVCQQRTNFGNLGGTIRLRDRLFAHFLVGSRIVVILLLLYVGRADVEEGSSADI